MLSTSLCAASHEASLAEHRSATLLNGTGLERNLALRSALGTNGLVHFAGGVGAIVLASVAAALAALGGGQVLTCVELLFTIREGEYGAAVAAGDLLISHKRKKEENNDRYLLLSFSETDR
jgi:hypothetical protein